MPESKVATYAQEVQAHKNSNAVRWYILTLPHGHRGGASALQAEVERRKRSQEPLFEYFAPRLIETRIIENHAVVTDTPLLFNYVFIHASEKDIYAMKQTSLQHYNFLPRRHGDSGDYYPYLTDAMMESFMWVAKAYGHKVPYSIPEPQRLVSGDTIRITKGPFKGLDAVIMTQKGSSGKTLVVNINEFWIPLAKLRHGEYELVSLTDVEDTRKESFDCDAHFETLHELMAIHCAGKEITFGDSRRVEKILALCRSYEATTNIIRCKLYALSIQSHMLLGHTSEAEQLATEAMSLYPLVTAEYAKALLASVIYLATDSSIYYDEVHALIAPWRKESSPKRAKRLLMKKIEDYDKWLKH